MSTLVLIRTPCHYINPAHKHTSTYAHTLTVKRMQSQWDLHIGAHLGGGTQSPFLNHIYSFKLVARMSAYTSRFNNATPSSTSSPHALLVATRVLMHVRIRFALFKT